MRVLHVIPSISPTRGGPSFAIQAMTRALARSGAEVEIATTDDDGAHARLDVPLNRPIERDGVAIRYFERQLRPYTYSRPLTHWLEQHARSYDLLHIHALFSHPSTSAGLIARRLGVPYVVRPLGVLNAWGMQNRRRLFKRVSFALFERRVLDGAALIHYTSRAEQSEAEALGVRAPGLVLPLGLDLPPADELRDEAIRHELRAEFEARHPIVVGRRVILFLSRLDPKKGLDLLLPAFASLRAGFPDAVLLIAGEGEASFVAGLRAQAASLGVADGVVWAGFVAGRLKEAALARADVFVLPSYSENFGIAAAEALGAGLPCVLSDQVGLAAEVGQARAALVVPCQVSALAEALESLLGDAEERRAMGKRAACVARERFSIEATTRVLIEQYERLANNGSGQREMRR